MASALLGRSSGCTSAWVAAKVVSRSGGTPNRRAQVGETVTQMDQVTQQNAALVEESAAAASSLKSQDQQLVQAVSVFRLASAEPALQAHRRVATTPTTARIAN